MQSKNDDGPAGAGPSALQELLTADYFLHFAVEVPDALGFGGWAGFGAKLSFAPNMCFFFLQPTEEIEGVLALLELQRALEVGQRGVQARSGLLQVRAGS